MDLAADHQLKVPVVRRPAFTIYLEQATPRHTFIHCTVHVRWSPAVKAELADAFAALKDLHGGPFFAVHRPHDTKHKKFLQMYGFRFVSTFTASDGSTRHIYGTR